MKLRTILAVTICAAASATGAASAKSAGFDSLDANKDGVLTQKELRSAFSRGFTRQLMQDDADKQLTREETIAAMGRIRESRAEKEQNKPALRTRSGKKIAPNGALDLSNTGFTEDFAKAVQENLDKGLSPAEAIAAAKAAGAAAEQSAYDTAFAAFGDNFGSPKYINRDVEKVGTKKELADYSKKSVAAAKKAAAAAQTLASLPELGEDGDKNVTSLADQASKHAASAEAFHEKVQAAADADPTGATGLTNVDYSSDVYNSALGTYESSQTTNNAAAATEKALESAAAPSG